MVSHKNALETMWKDTCTVVVRQKVKNSKTKLTDFKEVTLLENAPCKLSFETVNPSAGDPVATAEQSVKLFLSKDVEIPAGSKITVTRGGKAFAYASSGEPSVFTYHQEIALTKWRAWT